MKLAAQLLLFLFFLHALGNPEPRFNSDESDIHLACSHNGRPGVSDWDLYEHVGNGEFGSVARDIYDMSERKQEYVGKDNPSEEKNWFIP